MESVEITKYIDIAFRRKYLIIISVLLILLVGLAYAMTKPRIYKAETLILVVPQKVPENYVQSIVLLSMEERLRTIKQQVTSRTNLEAIIKDYQLYTDPLKGQMIMQDKIDLFIQRITISVARESAFSISFIDENPQKAMDVTNRLASNFISENLKIREGQAIGTSEFLTDEVASVKRDLEEREVRIKEYQEQHMGAMPEDLRTNLSRLGRLQNELDQLNSNLRAAEERKLVIQQQIVNAEMMQEQMLSIGSDEDSFEEGNIYSGSSSEVISLKERLASLEMRYTPNHPDVKRLRKMIEKLEAQKSESEYDSDDLDANSEDDVFTGGFSMTDLLRPQLEQLNLEIENIKAEISSVKSEAAVYEKRVMETPQREQELTAINRDYENIDLLYDSLLKRKLEAEISLSMEQKQKGEQFRVLDSARFPERPVSPNLFKIMLLALCLGIGVGCGLAFMAEILDTSYKTPEELEENLGIPVLTSMPFRYTEAELKFKKKTEILRASSLVAGFLFSAFAILLLTKGVDKTLAYFGSLLGMT